jgi:hypothetical protein
MMIPRVPPDDPLPAPSERELTTAVATILAALPEIGITSHRPLPEFKDIHKMRGDRDAINRLMLDWESQAYDIDLIFDRLTEEEQAELFFIVVPHWLYPDKLDKLMRIAYDCLGR